MGSNSMGIETVEQAKYRLQVSVTRHLTLLFLLWLSSMRVVADTESASDRLPLSDWN